MVAAMRREGGRRGRIRPMAEINVTPFVDVALVLLTIFMVTAPLLVVGVPVDLPKTQAKALSQDRQPLTVTVRRDGAIFLQNQPISPDDLVPKLQAIAANGVDERIFVRGDQGADWKTMAIVLGLLNQAGFTHIGLVTDVEKHRGRTQ